MGKKVRFMVAHRGLSFPCIGWIRDEGKLVAVGLDNATPGNSGAPRVWRSEGVPDIQKEVDWRAAREELNQKLAALNELLHAGLPWPAVLACKNAPGLFGAIIESAEARRQDAVRRPEPPLTGGPAARAWSRESSK